MRYVENLKARSGTNTPEISQDRILIFCQKCNQDLKDSSCICRVCERSLEHQMKKGDDGSKNENEDTTCSIPRKKSLALNHC